MDVRSQLLGYSISEPTRAELEHLVNVSGVGTAAARLYLVRRLAWHLGKAPVPIPPSGMAASISEFVERRARQVADENRRRLPALDERTMGGQ